MFSILFIIFLTFLLLFKWIFLPFHEGWDYRVCLFNGLWYFKTSKFFCWFVVVVVTVFSFVYSIRFRCNVTKMFIFCWFLYWNSIQFNLPILWANISHSLGFVVRFYRVSFCFVCLCIFLFFVIFRTKDDANNVKKLIEKGLKYFQALERVW